MKPITIRIQRHNNQTPQEICAAFLDTDRWPEFQGYSILPGIKSARFETRTSNMIGSRIRVHNTDDSSHVEEIIEWEENRKLALRFQEFNSPLKDLASHFIEEWTFAPSQSGTEVIRSMSMYPKNVLGWVMLFPISRLMKKAFEKNASQLEK